MEQHTPQQKANQRQNAERAVKPKLPVIFLSEQEAHLRDQLVAIYGSQAAAVKAALNVLAEKHAITTEHKTPPTRE